MLTSVLGFLPIIFFGIPLLFIFGLFVSGAFTLFFTNETDRGKDAIIKALTYFLILLAVFLVFVIVSYLIGQGRIFNPEEPKSEFPISPIGKFPSPPEFVKFDDYSFSGPWPISEKNTLEERNIYIVLCKKGENYDIMDLDVNDFNKPLTESKNYECWVENCDNNKENLYVGIYWTSQRASIEIQSYFKQIEKDLSSACGR